LEGRGATGGASGVTEVTRGIVEASHRKVNWGFGDRERAVKAWGSSGRLSAGRSGGLIDGSSGSLAGKWRERVTRGVDERLQRWGSRFLSLPGRSRDERRLGRRDGE